MTIASTDSKSVYVGTGSTAEFAIPFMFLREEDIEVILFTPSGEKRQTFGTDYLLTGVGEQTGGACAMTAPPAAGETLVIRRTPAITQEVDYVENDAFPAATHEAALDKLTMICQTLAERLDRTITFRVSSAVSGVELPEPQSARLLGWNHAGDNLINCELADASTMVLPLAVDQGGTGAADPANALTNLGFGAVGAAAAACDDVASAQAVLDAEPADVAILKADLPDLLQAVFGDEPQVHAGTDLIGLTVTRNHVVWPLTGSSTFDEVVFPYDGTYVFHIYPAGNALALAAAYKTFDSGRNPHRRRAVQQPQDHRLAAEHGGLSHAVDSERARRRHGQPELFWRWIGRSGCNFVEHRSPIDPRRRRRRHELRVVDHRRRRDPDGGEPLSRSDRVR